MTTSATTQTPSRVAGTVRALVGCLWFRDGWARAHTNRTRPCLQTHEERLWRRFLIANRRVWSAMQANDAANAEAHASATKEPIA